MSVYEKIPFIQESGTSTGHEVTVYALSTCGFCKRALSYLKEKNIAFRYVYVDTLPQDLRQELKTTLRDTFQRSLLISVFSGRWEPGRNRICERKMGRIDWDYPLNGKPLKGGIVPVKGGIYRSVGGKG